MGLVISIYSKAAYKEFILPSAKNADHVITLRSNYFQLTEDLKLRLEVLDGLWKIKKDKQYAIVDKNHRVDHAALEEGHNLMLYSVFEDEIHLFVKQVAASLHSYQKFVLSGLNEVCIGRDLSNNHICYDYQGMVSHRHAVIQRTKEGHRIVNQGQNGIYVNSLWVKESADLEFGAYINILGLHMVYLGDVLAVDITGNSVTIDWNVLKDFKQTDNANVYLKEHQSVGAGGVTYHRAPRNYEKLDDGTIEIEAPPEKEREKKKSLFMSIGPSLTMFLPMLLGCMLMIYSNSRTGGGTSLYMFSGLIMSVSSAVVGVFWTLLNLKQEKKGRKEREEYRFRMYSDYLTEKTNEIKTLYEDTERRLRETYPNAQACLQYDEQKGLLWNRNDTHDDFLSHRLGVGETPFQYKIMIPKKRFMLYPDELAEKPANILENYQMLIDVPITVDLMENRLIGIVGGDSKDGAIHVAKLLAIQAAANNSYSDVKLAFVYDNELSEDFGHWDFAKWLPHVWSEDKHVRFVAADREDATEVFYELARIFRGRDESGQRMDRGRVVRPHYIVFVSNFSLLEGEAFAKYALDPEEKLGLTTVILTGRREYLPNECEYIIENSKDFTGVYSVYEGKRNRQKIMFDTFDEHDLDHFARHLSSLHIAELEEGGEIPSAITFFEMFHINRIQEYPVKEMWAKSRTYENIKGLLGQRTGGSPCYLDVHEKYHGPHGLVAGTTGSGKSETLQTYILSLAVNYSPDDIGFFIIDYKGGGMANLFDGLPHMVGSISNLSGNQVKRAMISIKSENRRRQRVFTEHGVNNINLYTKLYKNGEALMPIPHLFIIIDEFAELKREEPEFMKELISVAQVGRSLGVHLILATQKPSGTVDDNIWSNSKFRLCLRVQDAQDSKDMLHKPDAAYITQAGRGYLQVGNDELYELFQSGFSGAVYDENIAAVTGEIAKMINTHGKVEMTGNSVKLSGKKHAEEVWIEALCRIAADIFQSSKEAMKELTDGESRMEFMVRRMYQSFEIQKVDYEQSEYNSARLKDFLSLYFAAETEMNGRTRAENVILLAGRTGKKMPQPKEKTQLDVTKEYLAEVAEKNGYDHKISLWMPVLKEQIYLNEFEEFSTTCFKDGTWQERSEDWNLQIVLGKVDDPENQSQMPIFYDLAKQGHAAICGSIVSGKSTLMQTMVYALIHRFSPKMINIYAMDFSSRSLSAFEEAPHVGGIMYESDLPKIAKFFNMLKKMVKERKELFKGGNYKQYVQKNGIVLPAIVFFVDNYAAFKEKTEQQYENQLIQISKEGVSLGIYLVVSGSGFGYSDISSRVGENMETIFCLALADKYAYGELLHNMHIEVMPEVGIKGRGLAYYGSRILEYQAALSLEAENDYQRMEDIQKICILMKKAWTGEKARKIPEIPKKPVWSVFTELSNYKKLAVSDEWLPVAYDEADADLYSIPLREIYCYLIMGGGRTGKTNFMQVMIQSAIDKKAHICIFDSKKGDLKRYSNDPEIHYAVEEEKVFEYMRDILTPEFQKRNREKNELLAQDYDESEIFDRMKEKQPYFIFIPDLSAFVHMVYSSKFQMAGFMETLIAKGRYHHIYFVAEIITNKISTVKGYKMYESFAEYRTGVHFGGRTNENNVLPFEYMSYKEQSVSDPAGIGILPGVASYMGTRKIVVPLARK